MSKRALGILLAIAVALVLAATVRAAVRCDGRLVRGLVWWECIERQR